MKWVLLWQRKAALSKLKFSSAKHSISENVGNRNNDVHKLKEVT